MIADLALVIFCIFCLLHVATLAALYRMSVRLKDLEARTDTVLRPRIQP